jgi:lipopolysaccharide transport system ATP-binding protein
MSDDVLVKVDNVSKRFCRSLKRSLWYGLQDLGSEIGGRRHGGGSGLPQSSADVQLRPDEFWAVKDVSFELRRGECLGLIGRNGAGKTTLLRMLNGLIKPDTGAIQMTGRTSALIALGAGFNPTLTGRENILTNLSILGITHSQIKCKLEEIIDFAEIEEFIDTPVLAYSSGMQVRLGFAVAVALEPDILILDEVLAVGDARFRAKCKKLIGGLAVRASTIVVSHHQAELERLCNCGLYLRRGHSIQKNNITSAFRMYQEDERSNGCKGNSEMWLTKIDKLDFSLQLISPRILRESEELSIQISIDAKETLKADKSFLTIINEAEEPAGSIPLDKLKFIPSGRSCITIQTDNIMLGTGAYYINCYLGSGSEGFIANAVRAERFTIDSDFENLYSQNIIRARKINIDTEGLNLSLV